MKRREFITLLGGAAAAWPLVARAQQMKLPTIGLLWRGHPPAQAQWTAAFVQSSVLNSAGVEGQTVTIEIAGWRDASSVDLAIIAELVRLEVDVIVDECFTEHLGCQASDIGGSDRVPSAGDPVGEEARHQPCAPGR